MARLHRGRVTGPASAAAATEPAPAPPGMRRRRRAPPAPAARSGRRRAAPRRCGAPQHRDDAQRECQQQGGAIEQAPARSTRLAREQPVQAAQQQEPGQEQQQRQPGHRRLHVIAPEARGHHAMGAMPCRAEPMLGCFSAKPSVGSALQGRAGQAASRSAASAASTASTSASSLNSSLCSWSPCSACLITAISWPASRGESKPSLWISSVPSPAVSLK